MDITSEYVSSGVAGGIPLLLCLLALIFFAFKALNRADMEVGSPLLVVWIWRAILTTVAFTFVSVSYFDQLKIFWALILAVSASLPCWTGESHERHALSRVPNHGDAIRQRPPGGAIA